MSFTNSFEHDEPRRETVDAWRGHAVLEFGTPWCGYCRAAQPLIAAALKDHPELWHVKIEDGRGRPLGRSFHVKLWPTLVFLHDGKELTRVVRPVNAEAVARALAVLTR